MRDDRFSGATRPAVRAAGRLLLDVLIPPTCAFCGTFCREDEDGCCRGCIEDLPWLGSQCPLCAAPLPGDAALLPACAACQQMPPPYSAAAAPLHYEFPVDAAIRAFKFRRRLHYVPAFVRFLQAALESLPADIDALAPVPLHWRRHVWRGFNQALELARPLARGSGLPLVHEAVRRRHTRPQSGLPAAARRANLRDAFALRGRLEARHVVIVDDVITTGATCGQFARALLAAGADTVSVLAIAKAGGSLRPD